jgi:WD40 repeat protein
MENCRVIAFSQDSQSLAWNPEPGVVRFWDVAGGTARGELSGLPEGCCGGLTYSPDGRFLAISSWPPVEIWDVASGQRLFSVENAFEVSFSPDGKTAAFSLLYEPTVALWDIASRREIRSLTGFENMSPVAPGYGVSFSPDWRTLLWLSERASGQLMDVATGTMGEDLIISDGRFSPDGSVLAATEHGWGDFPCTGNVCLFSVPQGGKLLTLERPGTVWSMNFSPDGRLLATHDFDGVRAWDVATGAELLTLKGQDAEFSPDGRLLAVLDQESGASTLLWGVP